MSKDDIAFVPVEVVLENLVCVFAILLEGFNATEYPNFYTSAVSSTPPPFNQVDYVDMGSPRSLDCLNI